MSEITLTFEEGMEVVECLSRLPYKEIHILMPVLVMKLAEAQESKELQDKILEP